MKKALEVSVVVPVFNERESLSELYSRLIKVLDNMAITYEVIFVDDGSSDGSFDEIKKFKNVKAYRLSKNNGQSYALACGIKFAEGQIIVTIDSDLENHPEDIPLLIDKLNEGYDVVAGWRKTRWKSSFIRRKLPSLIANRAISFISGVKIHDHGCGLTAYKAECLEDFLFADGIHRMIIPYIALNGSAKVCEVEVTFTPRKQGKSKYGISRTFVVILDFISYLFFKNYAKKPMHFFGNAGLFFIFLGSLTFIWSFYLKVWQSVNFNRTPLPVLVAIFVVIGFQFILMGLLGEIIVRTLRKKNVEEIYKIVEEHKG